MRIKQLPDNIFKKIIDLSVSLSSRDIAKKLEEEDSFKISHATINRYLKENRQERAEIFKAKFTEEVEKNLSNDMEIIQDVINTFYEDFKSCRLPLDRVKIGKALTDSIEIKFRNCGSKEQVEAFTWEKYLDENEQEEYLY